MKWFEPNAATGGGEENAQISLASTQTVPSKTQDYLFDSYFYVRKYYLH